MATPAERLADVATRRMDDAEDELRELRELVTELRLVQARQAGAELVWTRLIPVLSMLISALTLAWKVAG